MTGSGSVWGNGTEWIEVIQNEASLAHPAKAGDVGYDLYVVITEQTWLERLISWAIGWKSQLIWPLVGVKTIKSGVRISMPQSIWCEIRPRSSTSRKKLAVLGGTIDSGYQGELYTVLHNLGLIPRLVRAGDRYAQVVFHPACRPSIQRVGEFSVVSSRADTGFGSTGS